MALPRESREGDRDAFAADDDLLAPAKLVGHHLAAGDLQVDRAGLFGGGDLAALFGRLGGDMVAQRGRGGHHGGAEGRPRRYHHWN